MKGEMRICLLFLAVLQISPLSSAQNSTTTVSTTTTAPNDLGYLTQPADVSVAVGESAVFHCGVPIVDPNLTFTFYGSHRNYSLTCPHGHVEDIPQALYGSCEMKNGESLAVWTLQGTFFPDNGTRVVCQQLGNPEALSAVLHVYEGRYRNTLGTGCKWVINTEPSEDNGASNVLLIGCIIGGFFGVLLVAALLYTFLVKSESFQECFGGEGTEDDMTNIVSKD